MYNFTERILRLVKRLQFNKREERSHALDRKLVLSLKKSRIPNWTQLKQVSVLLSLKEKRILMGIALFIFISGGVWSYLYYKEHITIVPANGGIWSEALIGQPSFINPILAQTSDTDLDISRLIFRGLLKYDTNLTITTDLAERITIDETQTRYTVVLKENLYWHDGNPITVDDVIFTLQAIQDPEWESPLLISFKGVTIDKLDERTIIFNLPEPFGPFLSLLTTGIISKTVWEDIPASSARLAESNIKPVGNGPWKFSEFSKDKAGTIHSYALKANESYDGREPYLSEIVFKFYPDFIAALTALNLNQVMGLSFLPSDLYEKVAEPQKYNFNTIELPQYTALFINQKNNEFLKSKNVRLALTHAINKKELIEKGLAGFAEEISSPLLSLDEDLYTSGITYDPDIARSLLLEDGWDITDEEFITKDEETLGVTITTIDLPENSAIANIIKTNWEAIGVQTTVRLILPTEIQSSIIKNREYDILLYGAIVGADPDPYPFWHSSQAEHPGLNLSLFKDVNTDMLLEEARHESDIILRNNLYAKFAEILEEENPALFLYSPTYIYLQEKRLEGFNINKLVIPADRFNNSTEWYIKTKRRLK